MTAHIPPNAPIGYDPNDTPHCITDPGAIGVPGYRRLTDIHGRPVWIATHVSEALYEFEERGSVGRIVVWYDALKDGFSPSHADRAIKACLAARGKRYRFSLTPDGEDLLICKLDGLRAPPAPIKRALRNLNLKAKAVRTIEEADAIVAERALIATELGKPLSYRRKGDRRRPASRYGFEDWPADEWREFTDVKVSNLRSAFHQYCKTRSLGGRLDIFALGNGRIAALRHGECDGDYPASRLDAEAKSTISITDNAG